MRRSIEKLLGADREGPKCGGLDSVGPGKKDAAEKNDSDMSGAKVKEGLRTVE